MDILRSHFHADLFAWFIVLYNSSSEFAATNSKFSDNIVRITSLRAIWNPFSLFFPNLLLNKFRGKSYPCLNSLFILMNFEISEAEYFLKVHMLVHMFSPEHATDFPDLNFCKVSNNIGIKYN